MVLSGLRMGLIVLNSEFVVTSWNKTCEETWGLRESEVVGRELFSLDIGLNLTAVRETITQVMSDGISPKPITIDAINRRGKPIRCQLRVNALRDVLEQITGSMIIVDGTAER
jgi:two-component system CheB/CheR fusion protein